MVTMRPGSGPSLGRIDQYELVRKLGGGGFGVVYLARDTNGGVEVAIKTLHPLLKHSPEEMEALRAKFALVSRLAHPNIATALVLHPVRDVSIADETARRELKLSPGDSVMVMRYAPGVTLSKWRRQFPDGVVPPDLALEIGRQIASALDYAHSEKIVHRDVKPGNVMVETLAAGPQGVEGLNVESQKSEDGTGPWTLDLGPSTRIRVRLLDFGLAAEIRSSMSRISTEQGDTSGTRPYMAPEQWLGRKQDGRTDQYALACVLYELLSGAPPFSGVFETGDPMIMKSAVVGDPPEELETLPPAANAALLRALAKAPKDRFPTCAAFVAALSAGTEGRNGSTIRPPDGRAVGASLPETAGEASPPSEPSAPSAGAGLNLPPAGAPLSDLEAAQERLEARRVELEGQGFAASDLERAPIEKALSELESRIGDALAQKARRARESELAERRAAARRAADLHALEDIRRAVERRVSSLDATWTDGEFAKRRAAIDDARRALKNCTDVASLGRAKELRSEIYDAADWIERNTPARNGLAETERALDELVRACGAASAATLAADSFRRAERARRNAEVQRGAGAFEDAAAGYASAKGFYEASLAEARAAKAAAEVESARTYRDANLWDECLAAAEQALEWNPDNKEASALRREAQQHLGPVLTVSATLPAADGSDAPSAVGATLSLGGQTCSLPVSFQLEAGKTYGPGDIVFHQGDKTYLGSLPNMTADWRGERKAVIALREGHAPGDHKIIRVASIEIALRWCPPGSFMMGSSSEDETQHSVTVAQGFWMGKTQVTQGLWEKIMGSNPSNYLDGKHWFGFGGKTSPERPVDSVSWNDCQEFLRKFNALPATKASGLTFRLPTEEEWEYACRAGATGAYCRLADGTEITDGSLGRVAWFSGNSGDQTHPVGQKMPNAFGLYDMHGNVWEWTQTAVGEDRIARGGSCCNWSWFCESSSRGGNSPDCRDLDLGFRLCASGRAD